MRAQRLVSEKSPAQWFGVLGGPAAWTAQFGLAYALEEWFGACTPGSVTKGEIFNVAIEPIIIAINLALLAVAVMAGIVSLGTYRRVRRTPATGDISRERSEWMGVAGIFMSALFAIAIAFGLALPFLLESCVVTP
jgi:hypothetical protein